MSEKVWPSGLKESDVDPAWRNFEFIPKHRWYYSYYPPDEHNDRAMIVVTCYVHGPKDQRSLAYDEFYVDDLPNDIIPAEDLNAILSNICDVSVSQKFDRLPENVNV